MKKLLMAIGIIISAPGIIAQSVGIGTTTPNASAALEIKSNTKGLLMPRTSTTSRTGISSPAKGLMLYDTTTSSFWFHNGTAWAQISAGGSSWLLQGNPGTTPATNFIGTTDNQPLRFRVNNNWAGELSPGLLNTSLGYNAGKAVTTGDNNIALGNNALTANTTGALNTAIGSNALAVSSTSNYNVAVGGFALKANTTGTENTAIGAFSLYTNNTGYQNTATGFYALYSNVDGISNTAYGDQALNSNTSGSYNIAIGEVALGLSKTGDNNIAIGSSSLYKNSNGYDNTAIGEASLYNNNTGYYNTALGSNSLVTNVGGSNNTALGYNADVATGGLTNATAVGANAHATGSNSMQLGDNNVTGVNTYGNITVQNGKGLIRSSDGTQQKKVTTLVTVNSTIGAGGTINFAFAFSQSFSAPPDVYIGDIIGGGGFAEKVMTIASVSAGGANLFIYNPGNTDTPNYTVKIIAIGPQ